MEPWWAVVTAPFAPFRSCRSVQMDMVVSPQKIARFVMFAGALKGSASLVVSADSMVVGQGWAE